MYSEGRRKKEKKKRTGAVSANATDRPRNRYGLLKVVSSTSTSMYLYNFFFWESGLEELY